MANVVRETADTVYATFRNLKKAEREDLLDIATIEHRRDEPGQPLREYLASHKIK